MMLKYAAWLSAALLATSLAGCVPAGGSTDDSNRTDGAGEPGRSSRSGGPSENGGFHYYQGLKIKALPGELGVDAWTFNVGDNPALHRTHDQLYSYRGMPRGPAGVEARAPSDIHLAALPAHFDWRETTGLPPIKDQGECGACWAFATIGTAEVAFKTLFGLDLDLSEQYIISCNPWGWDCGGGAAAFDMLVNPGSVTEAQFPNQVPAPPCKPGLVYGNKLSSWGWTPADPVTGDATPEGIKQAIMDHGGVFSSIFATDAFLAYTGGVFNASVPTLVVNHSIVLVGWDDAGGYWIVKNSWGTWWGEGGYARVAYGACNIGLLGAFVVPVEPDVVLTVQNHATAKQATLTTRVRSGLSVSNVVYLCDGVYIGEAATPPYLCTWGTGGEAVGDHTVVAQVVLLDGSQIESNAVTLTILGDTVPPVVSITSPSANAVLKGKATITASATDNVGVTRLQIAIDGANVLTTGAASGSYLWNTAPARNGAHTIVAQAFDAAGNVGSSQINVTTKNRDTIPPQIVITSPTQNQKVVGKTLVVTVTATDNNAVTYVEYHLDGKKLAVEKTAPFTWTYNMTKLKKGAHKLQAIAGDAAGNRGTSAIRSFNRQ